MKPSLFFSFSIRSFFSLLLIFLSGSLLAQVAVAENFGNTGTTSFPSGWSATSNTNISPFGSSGAGVLAIVSQNNEGMLTTSTLAMADASDLTIGFTLKFFMEGNPPTSSLTVLVSGNGGGAYTPVRFFTHAELLNFQDFNFTEFTVATATYGSGADLRVRWLFENDSGGSQAFVIDDVTISQANACPPPTVVRITDVTDDAIQVDFRAVPGASSYFYSIWEGSFSSPPPTPPDHFSELFTNSGQITGLTANRQHTLFLRSNCFGGVSDFSGEERFTTRRTPPNNDRCISAKGLVANAGSSCDIVTGGTLLGATYEGPTDCNNDELNHDVWFSFRATASRHRISVTGVFADGGAPDNALRFELFSGDCINPVSLGCFTESNLFDGLTSGTDYLIRAYHTTSVFDDIDLEVCLSTPPLPPGNNDCSDAANLPVTFVSQIADGTVAGATAPARLACQGNNPAKDAWYTFQATSNLLELSLDRDDFIIELLRGSSCGFAVTTDCHLVGPGDRTLATEVTPGRKYFVRIYAADGQDRENGAAAFRLVHQYATSAECGDTVADDGPFNGPYSNNQDEVLVICPDQPNTFAALSFSQFQVDPGVGVCLDGLTIHNGASTSAPTIPSPGINTDEWCWHNGQGTGNLEGMTVVSTDQTSGCLTLRFRTDASQGRKGFRAAVSCFGPADLPTANIIAPGSGTVTANNRVLTGDGWTYYLNDGAGGVLLGLKLANTGTILPAAGVSLTAGSGAVNLGLNGCGAPYTSAADWIVMRRTWDATPTQQPSVPVAVRFFYDQQDFSSVTALLGENINHNELSFYKINNGDEEDLTANGNDCHQTVDPTNYQEFEPGEYTHMAVPFTSIHYAEFSVNTFSGGGGGASSNRNGALPVTWAYFRGEATKAGNQLTWATEIESATLSHSVERSTTGINWQTLTELPAVGNSTEFTHYQWQDSDPSNSAYYRIRTMNIDGTQQVSPTIILNRSATSGELFFGPNPTSGIIQIQQAGAITKPYRLMTAQGQLLQSGANLPTELDLSVYPAGCYFLVLGTGVSAEVHRVVRR